MSTPAPGLAPSYTPPAQQQTANNSLAANVGAFTQSAPSTGGAYFGTGSVVGGNKGTYNPTTDTMHGGGAIYGPYDPSALVQASGSFGSGIVGQPVYIDLNTAANMYYQWTPAQQNDFRAKMGLINSQYLTGADSDLATAWGSLVNQSAAYHAAGTNMTPWDILSKDIASNNGGKGKGNLTLTRNISTTALTSAPDSNAIFQAASTALLGRAPTADESKAFQANLNASERANPINQTIQYEYSPAGYVVDKNVLKSAGGETEAAKQNLAMQNLRGTSEYANYQASTTYMGALQQLLQGGTV